MFTCRVLLFLLAMATVSISPLAHVSAATRPIVCEGTRSEPSRTFRPIGRGGGSDPIVEDTWLNGEAHGGMQGVLSEGCRMTSARIR